MIISLIKAYKQHFQQGNQNEPFATWKKQPLDRLKAFYRVYIPADKKPRRQRIKKEDWVNFLSPMMEEAVLALDAAPAVVLACVCRITNSRN